MALIHLSEVVIGAVQLVTSHHVTPYVGLKFSLITKTRHRCKSRTSSYKKTEKIDM